MRIPCNEFGYRAVGLHGISIFYKPVCVPLMMDSARVYSYVEGFTVVMCTDDAFYLGAGHLRESFPVLHRSLHVRNLSICSRDFHFLDLKGVSNWDLDLRSEVPTRNTYIRHTRPAPS